IEDRWIGFELSQILQKVFKNRNLSAGRAQTPTLGWIIQRFKEHLEKRDITLIEGDGISLRVEGKIGTPGEAKAIVEVLAEEEVNLPPPPPFATNEMLREANRVLKLGASEIMDLAQNLFETGLITYHRTDSHRVSDAGLRVARVFLGDRFRPRTWEEGGAHECIRPTKPMTVEDLVRYVREGVLKPQVKLTRNHMRLYDLIFRRFMASMSEVAKLMRQRVRISIEGTSFELERYVRIAEPGWTRIYPYGVRVEQPLRSGEVLVRIEHRKVPKVPLYTQGDVIATMRERGIGRPSTYAVILQKLLMRRYVIERRGKLIPTKLGMTVYEYLTKNYPNLISEERTRALERKMSLVEEGEADYQRIIGEVYQEIRSSINSVHGPHFGAAIASSNEVSNPSTTKQA
ncbi:MAG: reverse gyrase, partial [Thermoprotei archaeon]